MMERRTDVGIKMLDPENAISPYYFCGMSQKGGATDKSFTWSSDPLCMMGFDGIPAARTQAERIAKHYGRGKRRYFLVRIKFEEEEIEKV